MPVRAVERLFRPESVAIVVDAPGTVASVLLGHALSGHAGNGASIMPIRVVGPVEGGVPRLADLPTAPDLCLLAASPDCLPGLVAEAGEKGARIAVLVGDRAPDAPARRAALLERARATGLRLVGPGSPGVAVPGKGLVAGTFHRPPKPGRIAFLAQSATVTAAVLDRAGRRGIGFSHVVGLGDEIDLGMAEVIDTLAGEPSCHGIVLALETVAQPRRFLSAARAAARVKPVVVLRSGRHHPADSPDCVYDALFRRAGLLRVQGLEGLFDAVETLGAAPMIRGDRLAVVANGRGIARLADDALAGMGGRAAQPATLANPLDLGEGAGPMDYAAACAALAGDESADAILVVHAPTAFADAAAIAAKVADAVPARRKAMLTCWLGEADASAAAEALAGRNIPVFETPERAVRALLHVIEFRRNQDQLSETPPSIPDSFTPDPEAARLATDDAGLLSAYGLHLNPGPVGEGEYGLILSVAEDPRFGPVLRIRAGEETVAALPPVNLKLAREALNRLGVVRWLSRARAPGVIDDLALTLVKLGQLGLDTEGVVEVVLDPVAVGPGGAALRGAAIRRRGSDGPPRVAPTVCPYPRELEQPFALPDGRNLIVRPVLPEDEPGFQALFDRLTPTEVRLRFFAPKQTLTHRLAARMTQIDYDREMALVIADQGPAGRVPLHGAVHLIGDGEGRRAEFAVMVAHDMAALGFGPLLLRRIIDYARTRRYAEVFGEVLSENRGMLRLCEAFGFTRRASPDDPGVTHVTLDLDGAGPP